MKTKMKSFYMNIAREAAKLSYAERKKVGAVAVTPQDVIIYSWNGRPTGDDNCCEVTVPTFGIMNGVNTEIGCERVTHQDVLHAESNLVAKAAREGVSLKCSTVFVTLSPCLQCAKQIFQAGVHEVIYSELYRMSDGVDFLNNHGIPCNQEG